MDTGTNNHGTTAALAFAACAVVYAQRIRVLKWFAPTVTGLYIYPIKSCGAIQVPSSRVTARGLEHDREFMLVDKANKFISQRTHPKMALIGCRITPSGLLEVTAPGMKPLKITLDRPARVSDSTFTVTVWGDPCEAYEVMGSMWFNEYLLGRAADEIKLVRMVDGFKRPTDPEYSRDGQAAFNDGFPLLIVSQVRRYPLPLPPAFTLSLSLSLSLTVRHRPPLLCVPPVLPGESGRRESAAGLAGDNASFPPQRRGEDRRLGGVHRRHLATHKIP